MLPYLHAMSLTAEVNIALLDDIYLISNGSSNLQKFTHNYMLNYTMYIYQVVLFQSLYVGMCVLKLIVVIDIICCICVSNLLSLLTVMLYFVNKK